MVRDGCTKLHTKDHNRISYPFHIQASTSHAQRKNISIDTSLTRNGRDRTKNETRRCSRSSASVAKLCIADVPRAKERRTAQAYFQSESLKSIRAHLKVSLDQRVSRTRIPSAERLDGQNRLGSGVFPSAYIGNTQTVPKTNIQRRTTANELSALRTQFSTKDVCFRQQLGRSAFASARLTPDSLSRRFFTGSPKSTNVNKPNSDNARHLTISRMDGKLREIDLTPMSLNRVSGCYLGHEHEPEIFTRQKTSQDEVSPIAVNRQSERKSKRTSKHRRNDEFCQLRYPTRTIELPSSTASNHTHGTQKYKELNGSTRDRPDGTPMVAHSSRKIVPYSYTPSYSLFSNGCIGCSVGRPHEQNISFRVMDRCRKTSALQPERNVGYSKSTGRARSEPPQCHVTHSVRQQNSCVIPQKRRRNEINPSFEPDLQNFTSPRFLQGTILNTPHTRCVQRRSRSIVTPPRLTRVAPASPGHRSDFRQMGSPSHRFIRVEQSPCGSPILHTQLSRSTSRVSQRIHTDLALPVSLDIPTAFPNAESASSLEQMSGCLPNSSTTMGTSFLEARPQKQSNECTMDDQEPRAGPDGCFNRSSTSEDQRNDSRGLEMWGWSESLSNWTDQQMELLKNSWRTSTIKTYKPVWLRWTKWALDNSICKNNPSGSDLARFLADLHQKEGLAYNTILCHKSVVSTLCNPESTNCLSSHPMVKRILKSISLSSPKVQKAPTWDTDHLISFISRLDPESNNLYEISRCTAALLLLCSGRRVHDLTLLTVDPNNCKISEDHIILWPIFGSKTDTATYRQSGWKLRSNKEHTTLDPVHWIKKLISAGRSRRIQADCNNLFITTCGKPKAASRCVIAGWVKKLLKESGIEASAGSFRAAVASKSWLDNCELDEILARGNWRSAKTFRRFYCKDIVNTRSNVSVTNLFKPVE